MQYYQHNFLKEQPDLNFHEPEVQDELLDRRPLLARARRRRLPARHHQLLLLRRASSATTRRCAPERRDYSTAPEVNPYNWQEHLYDKSRPEMIGFLRRLRALMDEFGDTAAVGEVGDAQRGMEIMGEYTRGDDLMQMCYAFEFLSPEAPSGRRVGQVLRRFATVAADGWACWAFSNHDVERHATRWHLDPQQLRVFLALLLTLRGSVCLYQGEELGLTEAYVPYEDLQDPYGKRFWPKFRGRDGCRTPMVWMSDNLQRRLLGGAAVAAGGAGAPAHWRSRRRTGPGLDARLLPADARLAEDAAGARQGRLRDRRRPRRASSASSARSPAGRCSAPSTSAPSR